MCNSYRRFEMILSGLKAERLFSFFFNPDPFYQDNLKLVELISQPFKSQTLRSKRLEAKSFYFSVSAAYLKDLFSSLSEADI